MAIPRRAAWLTAVPLTALALLATVPAAPALGLSPSACRVRNVDTGVTRRTLQAAVDAASPSQRLTVRGVCHGVTTIAQDLAIVGIRPRGAAKPRLDGDRGGSVVTVEPVATVSMRKLAINGGSGSEVVSVGVLDGGGVVNKGTLVLRRVVVRGNRATNGGGLYNDGALTLRDSSVVRNTVTTHGGGIIIDLGATVRLMGSTRISGNTAAHWGGGIYNGNATLTLRGSTVVKDNTAEQRGGGIYNDAATLRLVGAASIHHNTAPVGFGGGVFKDGGTYDNVVCGGNVHHNTGGNCAE
ncbi:hypothetical protein BH23CHL8_BH23CHL8_07820 [soil metagenome]